MPIKYECCIIGAGPAGLGAALELSKHGVRNTVIIDKNNSVGGLSRTHCFDGARFDIGPHCFFTDDNEINQIWHDTLGGDFQTVSRLTRVFYKNKYFSYPIRPLEVLTKLGPIESLDIILSFIYSQVSRNKIVTSEDWIIRKFGRNLYKAFFKTYIEKIWGIPCNQIGAEWAAQRIKGLDALEVIRHALLGEKRKIKSLFEKFEYPALGAGQMYEAICDRVKSQGVKLMLNSKLVRYNRRNNSIESVDIIDADGKEINISAKQFFSSIPLKHFFQMLNPLDCGKINEAAGMLRYRDHIAVNLLVKKRELFPDQWIYVHSPEVQIVKLANYNNFSKKMVENNAETALGVGYFTFKNNGLWNEPDESLAQLAINELNKMGLTIKNDIQSYRVVRETETYPVYYLGFQKYYDSLKSRVDQFTNFYSIGRAGMHQHNNMDCSLKSGILAARNYLELPGAPYALWDINIDARHSLS